MSDDIERLATELAALSPDDREQVMKRLLVLGAASRDMRARLQRDTSTGWGRLVGENIYDTHGLAVGEVRSVNLTTLDYVELKVRSIQRGIKW